MPDTQPAKFERRDVEVTLDDHKGGSLVIARTSREVSTEVYGALEAQFEKRAAESDRPGMLAGIQAEIDKQAPSSDFKTPGEPFPPLMLADLVWKPPDAVTALAEDVYAELHGEAARLIQILRWVFNRAAPAKPLEGTRLSWSLDQDQWHPLPDWKADDWMFWGGEPDLELTAIGVEALAQVWHQGDVVEPLARQIFLEAVALQEDHPRAAFILAVAAAEIGVKQFAAQRSDSLSEAWLLEEIQSPPLDRLLREYLVRLTGKRTADGKNAVPSALTTSFEKAIKKRNRLIHRGHEPPTEDELAQLFYAVNDLLYLLDWFAGQEWALRHLQPSTREAYEA